MLVDVYAEYARHDVGRELFLEAIRFAQAPGGRLAGGHVDYE